jgi:hypothetical protein
MAMVLKELVFTALPPAERDEALSWFLREAHLLSTLRHHSLPLLHASFSENDRSYLVMEAIPGPSLEMRAQSGPVGEPEVLRWGIELCTVLQYLHHLPEPIVYRDLKPANVLERADTGELVLVDFGVARPVAPGVAGTAVGTPGYAAPEQYQGFADARSDVYALGATLHRLLTGYDPDQEQPFRHPPVRTLRPEVSVATEAAIARALAMAPADRFPDALAMCSALVRALPATAEGLQAVTAPFYFWQTILPGVTAPLSLVCFNMTHAWLVSEGNPWWATGALVAGAYAPSLLYLQALLGMIRRRRLAPGPNSYAAVRAAWHLLLVRLALVLPFWISVSVAASTGSMPLGPLALLSVSGACLCWSLGIWRAGQAPRRGQPGLLLGSGK